MTTEPAAPPPPPPTPPSAPPADSGKSGGGMRALAVLLALVLAFAAAVMIVVAVDVGARATCEDYPTLTPEEQAEDDFECVDASSSQKSIAVVLAWASGLVAGLAALAALFLAVTGRGARTFGRIAVAAVLLVGLYFLVGAF